MAPELVAFPQNIVFGNNLYAFWQNQHKLPYQCSGYLQLPRSFGVKKENPDLGQVRTTTGENGAPFFCAVDVCRALGYGNSREALRKHVMEDDVTKRDTIDSLGRKQQTPQGR